MQNEDQALDDTCLTSRDSGYILNPLKDFACDQPGVYADVALAYCSSVDALFSVVSMPFVIASHAVTIQEYQRIVVDTSMDMVLEGDVKLSPERRARTTARSLDALEARCKSSEGRQVLASQSRAFLTAMVCNLGLRSAAQDLLRQGVVLAWGAFEVAAKDTFIAFLNERPKACMRLLHDPNAKRRLDVSKVPLQTLMDHDFDLSCKMGTLFSSSQDLSDIESIKAAFSPLLRSRRLDQVLANDNLWGLAQKRHLIVHRCGKVDATFAKRTKCRQGLGEHLQLTTAELLQHISVASEACLALLDSAKNAKSE